MKKLKAFIIKWFNKIKPFLKDWRLMVAFCIAWMITNGWSYIFIGIGTVLKIGWMWKVGTAYLAFLWLPCTPEKLITIPIALFIYKYIFKGKAKEGEINVQKKHNS